MPQAPRQLTPAEAQAKADECRALIEIAVSDSQRIMLLSIAQTWERIAKETKWEQ